MASSSQRKPLRKPGKTDPLPKHLQLTPERRKKIEEQQLRLRESAIARGRLTAEARRVQLGIAHEMSARTDVEMLEGEVQSAKGEEKQDKEARLAHARSRLAEARAQQGRYEEAAAVEPDEDKKGHYAKLWNAVWRDDEETCPCEPFVDGETSLTHDHVAEEVISQKHDSKLMPAITCNKCGYVNVRPLTPELQQLQRNRDEANDAMQGRDGKDLKKNAREELSQFRDVKVLKR